MTCIIGLEHEGDIYVGCDSASVEPEMLELRTRIDEKTFTLSSPEGDEAIVGFAGSFRVGQLIRHGMVLPAFPTQRCDDTMMRYMVMQFVGSLHATLVEGNAARADAESGEAELGVELLVGLAGRLYTVLGNYQVCRYNDRFAAAGAGAQPAMGAMFATNDGTLGPSERIKLALAAAAEYVATVRPPFRVSVLRSSPRPQAVQLAIARGRVNIHAVKQ